jgi:hypothetical protein
VSVALPHHTILANVVNFDATEAALCRSRALDRRAELRRVRDEEWPARSTVGDVSNAEINRELTTLKRILNLARQNGKLMHAGHSGARSRSPPESQSLIS